jgi:hypothetical protein
MSDFYPELNKEQLALMGTNLRAKLDTYISDRAGLEQQWLKNLRQYRGIYDPDVLKLLPEDKSRQYPRDTRTKLKAFVAKMMEMMFPASEENWDLQNSPIPSIQEKDLQAIIESLAIAEQLTAQQEGRDPQPLSGADIEKGVKAFAAVRKDNMEEKIRDQFSDKGMDYPQIAKRVVRSGGIYGSGFVMSPMVKFKEEREWEMKKGKWTAVTKTLKRPYAEFVKCWDIYPDLSAWDWDQQEGLFHRMVFSRHNFRMLNKRPGFIKENIAEYLRDHMGGNYTKRPYEASLDQMNLHQTHTQEETPAGETRKYEVFRWYGYQSAHDLKKLGLDIPEEDMDKDLLVDFWMVDNTLIKADLAPFGDKPSDVYHAFIYSEDEDSGLTGSGMPEELRDSQMGLCSATRAMFDNMAATAGPIYEIAVDLLKPNQSIQSVRSFQTVEREGDGPELAYDAVRAVHSPSHIADISNIISQTRDQFERCSPLVR